MTKRFCSLLTGAALAALSFPLAAQEALTTITSEAPELEIATPEAVKPRSFGERLVKAQFGTDPVEAAVSEVGEDGLELVTKELEAESPEARGTSAVFTIPGEFLVGSYNNMNWQFDMFMGEERSFKKIIVDVDVYHNGYPGRVNNDTTNYGTDYYCVFWLNVGRNWDGVIAYLNFLTRGGIENQSNLGGYWNPPTGDFGLRLFTGCPAGQGNWYHVRFEYDAENAAQYFSVSRGGQEICAAAGFAGESPRVVGNYFFIQFGSQYADEGPEGATIGWRFANARMQFIGDNPIGRRPRRR